MRVNLGLLEVDIPWDSNNGKIELVTLPLLAISTVTSFIVIVTLLVTTGFPSIGLRFWLIPFMALVCFGVGVNTFIWNNFQMPIDVKVIEYLIVIATGSGLIEINNQLASSYRPGLTLGIGIILMTYGWYAVTTSTLIISRTLPPPDETKLVGKRSITILEQIVGARVRRELEEKNAIDNALNQWVSSLFGNTAVLAIIIILCIQYRTTAEAIPIQLISRFLTALFLFFGYSVSFLLNMRIKEQLAKATSIGVVCGDWKNHITQVLGVFLCICLLSFIIPANLSPISSENLDELGTKVNQLMGALTHSMEKAWSSADKPLNFPPPYGSQSILSLFAKFLLGFGQIPGIRWSITNINKIIVLLIVLAACLAYKRIKHFSLTVEMKFKKVCWSNCMQKILQWFRSLPFIVYDILVTWLFINRPIPAQGIGVLSRLIRRYRLLLSESFASSNPSLIIKVLYFRMLLLGKQIGIERHEIMTPHEYAHLLASGTKKDCISEILSLTETFELVKYGKKPATLSLAKRVQQSWNKLRAQIVKSRRMHKHKI